MNIQKAATWAFVLGKTHMNGGPFGSQRRLNDFSVSAQLTYHHLLMPLYTRQAQFYILEAQINKVPLLFKELRDPGGGGQRQVCSISPPILLTSSLEAGTILDNS